MTQDTYSLIDGKVNVYKRGRSRFWQCSAYMNGNNHRVSTKEENLNLAKDFAREWYMAIYVESKKTSRDSRINTLIRKFRGEDTPEQPSVCIPAPYQLATQQVERTIKKNPGHLFAEAAEKFIAEYELSVAGQRNERYAKSHESRIRNHLIPFFGDTPLKKNYSRVGTGISYQTNTKRL